MGLAVWIWMGEFHFPRSYYSLIQIHRSRPIETTGTLIVNFVARFFLDFNYLIYCSAPEVLNFSFFLLDQLVVEIWCGSDKMATDHSKFLHYFNLSKCAALLIWCLW